MNKKNLVILTLIIAVLCSFLIIAGAQAKNLKVYSNGSLIKTPNGKIFVISNQQKQHIGSLAELKKYSGLNREIAHSAFMCFYGGYLYAHSGRGWAMPKFVAADFLEKLS